MAKIRKGELQILSLLEINARKPFSSFRKKIRKSQQQISYIVKSLIEKKTIKNFYTLIDYSKLGVLHFRVYFRLNFLGEESHNELINYLVKSPYTAWVASCGGRYDLICTFFANNPSQFNKNLREIMEKFPKQIQNYVILTTIVDREFGRKYLFKIPVLKEKIIGGDRDIENVDEMDMKILSDLSEDARRSSVKIANELSLTSKTIVNRIKKLVDKKIIRGFRPLLSSKKIGYNTVRLVIKYHNISSELEDKFINYLKTHPNVVNVVKTLGEWNIEIKVDFKEQVDLKIIERDIRQRFALLIQQIESIPIYKTHKKSYFPKFLLES